MTETTFSLSSRYPSSGSTVRVTVSPDRACPMSVLTRPWSLSRIMTLRRTRTEEPPPLPLPVGVERVAARVERVER